MYIYIYIYIYVHTCGIRPAASQGTCPGWPRCSSGATSCSTWGWSSPTRGTLVSITVTVTVTVTTTVTVTVTITTVHYHYYYSYYFEA